MFDWKKLEKRLFAKVEKTEGGCWEWQGGRSADGYGYFKVEGRRVLAHRVSWQIENGLIPEGLIIFHHCDNPPCVRPDHLYAGTHQDNMDDVLKRGRHPAATVTEEEVMEIRRFWNETAIPMRRKFPDVSGNILSQICTGASWAHLPVLSPHKHRVSGS